MSLIIALALALLAALVGLTLAQRFADSDRPLARWARPVASPKLRGGIARSLVALAIIPAATLALLGSGKRAMDYAERDSALVADAATSASRQLDAFLLRHTTGIRSAAEAIALDRATTQARLGEWLLRYHPIYGDFRTMLVAGPTGDVLAGTVRANDRPTLAPNERRSVSDRPYFRVPMTTGRDYVSDGFRGRGFGTDPLIAISSPIVIDGATWGVVEGSLNLNAFQRLDASLGTLTGAQLVLTDAGGAVLYSSDGSGFDFLERLPATPYASALRSMGATTEITVAEDEVLLVGHARTSSGWHVLVAKPKPTWVELLRQIGWLSAGWLLVSALAAGALAWSLAARIVRPMRRLERALSAYAFGSSSPFAHVRGLPAEYQYVFRRLHGFVVRLASGHRRLEVALERAQRLEAELRTTLDEREAEVSLRTAELAAANRELESRNRALRVSEEHFRTLAESASVGIVVCDRDGRCTYANERWCEITGTAANSALGTGWQGVFADPDFFGVLASSATRVGFRPQPPILRVVPARGPERWLQARAATVHTEFSADACLMCTFEDVTELVESRELIRDLAQRLENVKEDERRALAQTLHEGIAQDVFAAKLSIDQLRRHAGDPAAAQRWAQDADAMIGDVLRALRDVTNELRPTGFERLSMLDVLRWHAERFSERAGLPVVVHESCDEDAAPRPLHECLRLALFRAVQEALTNVAKHARATRATVTLEWRADDVVVTVVDDGEGPGAASAQARAGSFGLVGLRERVRPFGGTVTLAREPGAVTTTFTVRVPLDDAQRSSNEPEPVRAMA